MAGLLSNFRNTFIVGFILAVLMIVGYARMNPTMKVLRKLESSPAI